MHIIRIRRLPRRSHVAPRADSHFVYISRRMMMVVHLLARVRRNHETTILEMIHSSHQRTMMNRRRLHERVRSDGGSRVASPRRIFGKQRGIPRSRLLLLDPRRRGKRIVRPWAIGCAEQIPSRGIRLSGGWRVMSFSARADGGQPCRRNFGS